MESKAERFRRIRAVFDGASALPVEQRAAYVREHSAGDGAMELEVGKLLASVESAKQNGFWPNRRGSAGLWPLRWKPELGSGHIAWSGA